MTDAVLVSIVTFNDGRFLKSCLESVKGQTLPVKIKIFDNASEDDTCRIAREFGVELHRSRRNEGFSRGHNHNLQDEDFETALLLNADVILRPNHVEILKSALQEVTGAGMAGGKLLRMDASGRVILRGGVPLIDSAGIYFTPSQRHFDRGNSEEDRGQYSRRQLVFGITGAALLISHALYEDLRNGSEFLDEDFFAFREDADLAWRAQLRGWKAVYEPEAQALHYRRVLPSRRRQLPAAVNYHSVKNRYLMRIKNIDWSVRRRCFPYMWIRDLGVLLYLLILEWSSWPALLQVWQLRSKFREKRDLVQGSRRAAGAEMARWFSFRPQARDI